MVGAYQRFDPGTELRRIVCLGIKSGPAAFPDFIFSTATVNSVLAPTLFGPPGYVGGLVVCIFLGQTYMLLPKDFC